MKCTIEDCENPCEGTLWICATHNAEKRKAERESKKVKVIHPIKKMSAKRVKEVPVYSKLKNAFLETNMACQIRLPGCFLNSFDVHHTAGRIGTNLLDTSTWKAVCRHCHDLIHNKLSADENRLLGFKI